MWTYNLVLGFRLSKLEVKSFKKLTDWDRVTGMAKKAIEIRPLRSFTSLTK